MKTAISISLIILVNFIFSQKKEIISYNSFVDSAAHYITQNHQLSTHFLNSIPKPLENNINNIGKYFYLKAVIEKGEDNTIKAHENFILSIKNAKTEKDYKTAGDACHELALSLYAENENEQAEFYIKKAKFYYTKINNTEGLLSILQIPAYRKYLSHDYQDCIKLTMEHIKTYEKFTKDQYYILLADFMLVSSHIGLNNKDSANKYYTDFRSLKNNPTIYDYDYQYFNDYLYIDYINYFFKHDQIDSCLLYLSVIEKNIPILDNTAINEIYLFYIDVYKKTNNKEKENAYLDSLRIFKEKNLNKNIQGTFEIHKSLIEADKKVDYLTRNSKITKVIVLILIIIIISFFVLYYNYKRKVKSKINTLKDKMTLVSFIDSKHEKLKIKTKGLEEYIIELKKNIKNITQEKDTSKQQKEIAKLYKDLHLKTTNSSSNGGSHSELVNKLNAPFFIKIKNLHPQLNESEIVICYYIAIGFKNKEIAVFLKLSLRSIESKRFRISKKINLSQNENLADYLNNLQKKAE